jgi:hypothetical protein
MRDMNCGKELYGVNYRQPDLEAWGSGSGNRMAFKWVLICTNIQDMKEFSFTSEIEAAGPSETLVNDLSYDMELHPTTKLPL